MNMNMQGQYNVEAIQFLIASFNGVIKAMGKTDKAVAFFKSQVDNLQTVSQIKYPDIDFVYRLLGMKNTNAVKWDITIVRLDKFTRAMNYMICCKTPQQRRDCLNQLKDSEAIDSTVYNYIAEIYGLKEIPKKKLDDFKTSEFGRFGQFSTDTKLKNNISSKYVGEAEDDKKIKLTNSEEVIREKIDSNSKAKKPIKKVVNSTNSADKQCYVEDLAQDFMNSHKLPTWLPTCHPDPVEAIRRSGIGIRRKFGRYLLDEVSRDKVFNTQGGIKGLVKAKWDPNVQTVLSILIEYTADRDSKNTWQQSLLIQACDLFSNLFGASGKFAEDLQTWKSSYNMHYKYPNPQAVCKCDPTTLYKQYVKLMDDLYTYCDFRKTVDSEDRDRIEIGDMIHYNFIQNHRVSAAFLDNIKDFTAILDMIDVIVKWKG